MGSYIMDSRKYVFADDSFFCNVAREYYDRYLVKEGITAQGWKSCIKYVKKDPAWITRVKDLYVELGGEYNPEIHNVKNTVRHMLFIYRDRTFQDRFITWSQTDLYRLTKDGNVLLEGTLPEIELFKAVKYDGNEWWFAKGADGTVLNNEQEVNDYQSNILRERKYVDRDAIDNFVLWKTE